MFQSFTATTQPENGPRRLAAFRKAINALDLDGYIVPRADAHQGEYVAPCDDRLSWLTGFTGSAGFAAILTDQVGVFIDGRYRLQVREQVDLDHFTPVNWPATTLADWLNANAPSGARIGFDPWLHPIEEVEKLRKAVAGNDITLIETANQVDAIWPDRPAPPSEAAFTYPAELAGKTHDEKRHELAAELVKADHAAAVLTLPDSICWLLNIRGSDVPRVPIMQGFAILHSDARVQLFADPAKLAELGAHLGEEVTCQPVDAFSDALAALSGNIRVDPSNAPLAIANALDAGGAKRCKGRDPCILPKACKSAAELSGARAAHQRDAVAVVEFLHWLDGRIADLEDLNTPRLTEIDCAVALEGFRRATNQLHDISFDTIAGAGPHGAIMHYRVTDETNRALAPGELFLIDSGGQYLDGTTDITRTIAVGPAGADETQAYTRVLRGLIAVSQARFPKGLAGRDIDPLARTPLWQAGQDFDHGTGHGVGAFLSVHEGPQRISRVSMEPLQPGMILSNEPGYYRDGAFGIRLENLIAVEEAPALDGADAREMYCFETLTYVPFDRRLIDLDQLNQSERDWIDAYHAKTRSALAPYVSEPARDWLFSATERL